MSESTLGLLLVIADPDPAIEEEFNAWFDTEHLPERLGMRGFLSGRRFVSLDRPGRYMVMYDLVDVGALHTDEYRQAVTQGLSPWTRRILPRQPAIRHEARQVLPGDARQVETAQHVILRFDDIPDTAVALVSRWISHAATDTPNVAQRRLFEITDGGSASFIAVVSGAGELVGPPDFQMLGPAAKHLTLMESFAPYRSTGRR